MKTETATGDAVAIFNRDAVEFVLHSKPPDVAAENSEELSGTNNLPKYSVPPAGVTILDWVEWFHRLGRKSTRELGGVNINGRGGCRGRYSESETRERVA